MVVKSQSVWFIFYDFPRKPLTIAASQVCIRRLCSTIQKQAVPEWTWQHGPHLLGSPHLCTCHSIWRASGHKDSHQQEKHNSWQLPGHIISFHHWLGFSWISYGSGMATVYSQNNCGLKPQGNWHHLRSMSETRKIQKIAWTVLNLLSALKCWWHL